MERFGRGREFRGNDSDLGGVSEGTGTVINVGRESTRKLTRDLEPENIPMNLRVDGYTGKRGGVHVRY